MSKKPHWPLEPVIRLDGKVRVKYPFFEQADVKFSVRESTIRIGNKQRVISRGVVQARPGANVLPYFSHKGSCFVVLVEQFRLAVGRVTFEAPGGVVEGDVKRSMARELREETGIKVNPRDIEIKFREYYLASLLCGSAWGGIVGVRESQLPGYSPALEDGCTNEYTNVHYAPLLKVQELKSQFSGKVKFDLWTSRLLDEVAKKVGLLKFPSGGAR